MSMNLASALQSHFFRLALNPFGKEFFTYIYVIYMIYMIYMIYIYHRYNVQGLCEYKGAEGNGPYIISNVLSTTYSMGAPPPPSQVGTGGATIAQPCQWRKHCH